MEQDLTDRVKLQAATLRDDIASLRDELASVRSLELVEARRGEMLICLTIVMLDEFNVLCWTPTHITIFYYLPLTYYTISSHQTKFNCLFQVSCHYLSSLLPQPLPCAPTSIPNDLLLAIITVATFKLDMYYLFLRHSWLYHIDVNSK